MVFISALTFCVHLYLWTCNVIQGDMQAAAIQQHRELESQSLMFTVRKCFVDSMYSSYCRSVYSKDVTIV